MKRFVLNQIPTEITNDQRLKEAASILPKNYNFELPKTIWKIRNNHSKRGKNFFYYLLAIFKLKLFFLSCVTDARRIAVVCMYYSGYNSGVYSSRNSHHGRRDLWRM